MTEEEQIKENEAKAAEKVAAQERKYALAKAIKTYHNAATRFEAASIDFNNACKDLREKMTPDSKYILEIDWITHLFTCDKEGNFDIQPIDKIH